jgi:chlorophyll synthase
MTLNDFKSIEGDRRMGVASLPARLGASTAARVACVVMIVPQLVIVALLWSWGMTWHAAAVAGLVVIQMWMMTRFAARPVERALWYSGFGVPLYVSGMMVSAFAVRGL